MEFTPFDAALGIRQGRIAPIGFVPTSGEFALVLGSDTPGHIHDVNLADGIQVTQSVDVTSDNFIRAVLRFRNATTIPPGVNWEASIVVAGVKRASMVLEPGRTRDRIDMVANVSKLSGVKNVAVRLDLVAV